MRPSGLAPRDPALPSDPDEPSGAGAGHALPSGDDAAGRVPTQHGAPPAEPEPGPLLAAGNCADVFALDDARVLRRYRSGQDATSEVALMRHVAAHGFPVPRVDQADGADIVMERLHGPTLLQALGAEEVSLPDGAAILTDLHRRLHAIPAPGAGAGDVVLHLDLHPGNVILSDEHGPALVDWANARAGRPGLDVALTALIIAEVAVDAGGAYSQGARALLAAFLAASDVDPSGDLDEGARVRAADPSLLDGEIELVPQAVALIRGLVEVSRPA